MKGQEIKKTFLGGGSLIKLYPNIPDLAIVTVINLLPLNSKFTLLCENETEPCQCSFASKHTISTADRGTGWALQGGEGFLSGAWCAFSFWIIWCAAASGIHPPPLRKSCHHPSQWLSLSYENSPLLAFLSLSWENSPLLAFLVSFMGTSDDGFLKILPFPQ